MIETATNKVTNEQQIFKYNLNLYLYFYIYKIYLYIFFIFNLSKHF